ncbi:hypothetical protein G6F68_013136 [Rhizopus microsporus]|nr:hypothetical protein G6F68_013136 [Rhizopus microsporus]
MVAIIPFTRLVAQTSIGTTAAIVPLSVAAIPFMDRIAENAMREVDPGLLTAARAMGASPMQIILKVLLPEALPGLIAATIVTVVSLIGYSAMAGAIGGGGLISGVAAYIKQLRPEIKIIGVQTADSDALLRSVRAGRRVQLNDVGLFSDGTAVKMVGAETFKLTRKYVDDFVVVDTDSICAAIKDVFQDTRSVLEPAGAMAVAGAKHAAASPATGLWWANAA